MFYYLRKLLRKLNFGYDKLFLLLLYKKNQIANHNIIISKESFAKSIMTEKETKITQLIYSRIKQKDPKAEIILFGSHARGQATEESDWDILILIATPKSGRKIEDKYRDELFDIELNIGEPISTLIYSKKDWETKFSVTPLYQNIKTEGIMLK